MDSRCVVRDVRPEEWTALGELLVRVYSSLPGFPTPAEQPAYYDLLTHIGRFAEKPGARVLVALADPGELLGGVVYFGDMAHYGSGGTATSERHASGIRLLAVDPASRGRGVGKALTRACIDLAQACGHAQVILHTTRPMQVAWAMYERLGFKRSEDLDFLQHGLPVFGFRLPLAPKDQETRTAPISGPS